MRGPGVRLASCDFSSYIETYPELAALDLGGVKVQAEPVVESARFQRLKLVND